MNAGKVILGALTIIGCLPISLTMTKHKIPTHQEPVFLSVSLGYTHMKQRKLMSTGSFSGFCNMSECAAILLTQMSFKGISH